MRILNFFVSVCEILHDSCQTEHCLSVDFRGESFIEGFSLQSSVRLARVDQLFLAKLLWPFLCASCVFSARDRRLFGFTTRIRQRKNNGARRRFCFHTVSFVSANVNSEQLISDSSVSARSARSRDVKFTLNPDCSGEVTGIVSRLGLDSGIETETNRSRRQSEDKRTSEREVRRKRRDIQEANSSTRETWESKRGVKSKIKCWRNKE